MALTIEVFGNIYDALPNRVPDCLVIDVVKSETSKIQLRDYQQEAYEACLSDLRRHRSSLIVLATGLGKTILFSKIIESWKGRVLVLVHLEELLQNAYQEIEQITGEVLGIERGPEHHLGERIVVGTIQTVSLRLDKFDPKHFSLIIIDEAHHSASEAYKRLLRHFESARLIGLTATDARADGKKLPFEVCSYRMGIREGIESGYLVPIRGRRIVVDSINLTKVKTKESGDFDEQALDDEMVKGASAIADVIAADFAFDKGILFFPGCASAKLTSELLNKRIPDLSVYVDGKITGKERRILVNRLRQGHANWLCNVGIATEGFNWPEASVIGMCAPTLSRAAYVQRAGRGTRPLAGLLNGFTNAPDRISAIADSVKPYMQILDFVGISANLNLISAESFLEPVENETKEPKEPKERKNRAETDEERPSDDSEGTESDKVRVDLGISRIARTVQSRTVHSTEEFDPFEASGQFEKGVELKVTAVQTETLSEKQYALLKRCGVCDDATLTRQQAQQLVKFIAGKGFRLNSADKEIARKLYKDIKNASI